MAYSIIEKYIFKVRYIYRYINIGRMDTTNVVSLSMDNFDASKYSEVPSAEFERRIKLRSGKRKWHVFMYIENEIVKGYSFLHLPTTTDWYDSLPTTPTQGRETSTFVEPEFRGQGIRSVILYAQYSFCQEIGRELWAVIERSNTSSIRSAIKSGGIKTKVNYLIKFFGKNVVSVTTKPIRLNFLINMRNKV